MIKAGGEELHKDIYGLNDVGGRKNARTVNWIHQQGDNAVRKL